MDTQKETDKLNKDLVANKKFVIENTEILFKELDKKAKAIKDEMTRKVSLNAVEWFFDGGD